MSSNANREKYRFFGELSRSWEISQDLQDIERIWEISQNVMQINGCKDKKPFCLIMTSIEGSLYLNWPLWGGFLGPRVNDERWSVRLGKESEDVRGDGNESESLSEKFPCLSICICLSICSVSVYWTISFKSTGGVMCDRIYLFDISTVAEFLRDTPQNFDNPQKFWLCFALLGGKEDTHDSWEVQQKSLWCVTLTNIWHQQRGLWCVTVELSSILFNS
jgi:hypothetical protein